MLNAIDEGPVSTLRENDVEFPVAVDITEADIGGRLRRLLEEERTIERRKRVRGCNAQDSEYETERHWCSWKARSLDNLQALKMKVTSQRRYFEVTPSGLT